MKLLEEEVGANGNLPHRFVVRLLRSARFSCMGRAPQVPASATYHPSDRSATFAHTIPIGATSRSRA